MTGVLILATGNPHKVVELSRVLGAAGLDLEVRLPPSDAPEVVESGATFAANALLKAHALAAHTGLPALADDSGLCVDALNGMPGVLSARWSGGHGDDAANVTLLLAQVADVPDERRSARFVCAAALVLPGDPNTEVVREGTLEGAVGRAPRGTGGFGYDPVFVPFGSGRTLAEYGAEEKDAISHRGNALRAIVPDLRALL